MKSWTVFQLLTFALALCLGTPASASPDDLVIAIRKGDPEQIIRLVEELPQGALELPVTGTGGSLLHLLFDHHHRLLGRDFEHILNLLVENGLPINQKDNKGYNALAHYISRTRRTDSNRTLHLIDLFLAHDGDLQATTREGLGLLHLAAAAGNTAALKHLVGLGMDINRATPQGMTPLMIATRGSLDTLGACIKLGADLERKESRGRTALHLAIEYKQPRIIDHLLRAGADIESRDQHGRTPLSVATYTRQWALVRYLVNRGADLGAFTGERWTVGKFLLFHRELELHELAADRGVKATLETEGDMRLLKHVIEKRDMATLQSIADSGARVQPGLEKQSPLFQTLVETYSNNYQPTAVEAARLLKIIGADVNLRREYDGNAPLHNTVLYRRPELVKLLIANGADVNQAVRDDGGREYYPLDFALQVPEVEVIRVLLDAGASANLQNYNTWAAISQIARQMDRVKPGSVTAVESREILGRVLKGDPVEIDASTNPDAQAINRELDRMRRSGNRFASDLTAQVRFVNAERPRHVTGSGLSTPGYRSRPLDQPRDSVGISSARPDTAPTVASGPVPEVGEKTYSSDARVHVIGVYEGSVAGGKQPWWSKCRKDPEGRLDQRYAIECHQKYATQHTEGTVSVTVSGGGKPLVLVLMAYDPVHWTINTTGNANIEGIILAGYHGQRVSGTGDNVYIEARTYEPSPCGRCQRKGGHFYAYSQDKDPQKFRNAMKRIVQITSLYPSSFQGGYKGKTFHVSM